MQTRLVISGFFVWMLMAINICQAQEPTKELMIQSLSEFCNLLENQNYEAASDFLVLPPDFEPQMIAPFLDRGEISQQGIDRLKQDAKFGKASEVFSEERAKLFAERAGVDVAQCYGFNHEINEIFGEVVGFWDGARFKFIRIDDVGRFGADSEKEPMEAAPPAAKPTQSLAELEAAVDANSEDVAARALYAQALFEAGSLPAAWEQLMAAYKIDPNHDGVAKGTGIMIQVFAERDLFTAGIPRESIIGLLGEPREVVQMGATRERLVYAYCALDFRDGRLHELIDLRGLTEVNFKPTETVSVSLDNSGWRCGHRRRNKGNTVAMYYLPGESYGNWEQQVTVERILNGGKFGTVEETRDIVVKQLKDINPKTQVKTLHVDDDSVIIATMVPSDDPAMTQHKLDHLMLGPTDLHRFSITVRGDEPSRDFQMKWLAIAKTAKLKPVQEGK